MNRRAYPTDLTDTQWQVVKPLLPNAKRKRKHSLREIINALFYHTRAGGAWRMLPHDFPPWETVYGFFNRWSKDGTLERVHDSLRERTRSEAGREPTPSAAIVLDPRFFGYQLDHGEVRFLEYTAGWDGAEKKAGRPIRGGIGRPASSSDPSGRGRTYSTSSVAT